jgi:hypothetical protein
VNNKIYRIQDSEGRGPWRPGFSHTWVEPRADHDNLIPGHKELNMPQNFYKFRCYGFGCTSKHMLQRWFTPSEYQTLLRYGYRAVEISVNEILASSDTQCLFGRNIPLNLKCSTFRLY